VVGVRPKRVSQLQLRAAQAYAPSCDVAGSARVWDLGTSNAIRRFTLSQMRRALLSQKVMHMNSDMVQFGSGTEAGVSQLRRVGLVSIVRRSDPQEWDDKKQRHWHLAPMRRCLVGGCSKMCSVGGGRWEMEGAVLVSKALRSRGGDCLVAPRRFLQRRRVGCFRRGLTLAEPLCM
jgi:hypothetical protein